MIPRKTVFLSATACLLKKMFPRTAKITRIKSTRPTKPVKTHSSTTSINFGNLNPIWAQDQSRIISGSTSIPNITTGLTMNHTNLVNGVISSNCLLPCTTVTVHSKLISSYETYSRHNWIGLVPSQTVMVTKTNFVQPSIATILSKYGGSMGLWLGLGTVQRCHFFSHFIKNICIQRSENSCNK